MPDRNLDSAVSAPDNLDLKTILDAAGTMIIATDVNGIVRTFNPAAERMIGWRADEVIGKQSPALWHDSVEVALRAAELSRELGRTVSPGFEVFVAKAAAGETEQRAWTFIRKDGSRFPVQLAVSALRDRTGQDRTGQDRTGQDRTDHWLSGDRSRFDLAGASRGGARQVL